MIWVLTLFAVGLLLSAFFSGCETGFYRATRYRFAIDGLRGDPISRALLWLTNNPTLFVATTLIGNNLANYLTSRSIVEATSLLLGSGRWGSDIVAPLVVTPFVFVYGELLPKNIYYRSPNRLLRKSGPLFLLCGVVFAPVSAALWLMARGLHRLVGESPEIVRLRLARTELQRAIDEGHDVGILQHAQRALLHAVIEGANEPINQLRGNAFRYPTVSQDASDQEVIEVARRHRTNVVLVGGGSSNDAVGYIRVIDVHLYCDKWQTKVRPVLRIKSTDSLLRTLQKLKRDDRAVAQIAGREGRTLGIVATEDLLQMLLEKSN